MPKEYIRAGNFMLGLLLVVASYAHANDDMHPLVLAARAAAQACAQVEQYVIEDCGNSGGRKPENSAARRAVIRVHNQRAAFMYTCQGNEIRCIERADALVMRGINQGYNSQ